MLAGTGLRPRERGRVRPSRVGELRYGLSAKNWVAIDVTHPTPRAW